MPLCLRLVGRVTPCAPIVASQTSARTEWRALPQSSFCYTLLIVQHTKRLKQKKASGKLSRLEIITYTRFRVYQRGLN